MVKYKISRLQPTLRYGKETSLSDKHVIPSDKRRFTIDEIDKIVNNEKAKAAPGTTISISLYYKKDAKNGYQGNFFKVSSPYNNYWFQNKNTSGEIDEEDDDIVSFSIFFQKPRKNVLPSSSKTISKKAIKIKKSAI